MGHQPAEQVVVRALKDNAGLSLIEVTMAVAIFAIVIGLGAQLLVVNYTALDTQEQRIEAIQACRSVMSEIRDKRAQFQGSNNSFDMGELLSWIRDQNEDGWERFLQSQEGSHELPGHAIEVDCRDLQGNVADHQDLLLELHVTSSWQDRQGRTMEARLATMLADI